MAVRTRPAVVGTVTPVIVASGSSITFTTPSGLVAGDLLVAAIRGQLSSATGDYSSSGWTRLGPAFVASSTTARVMGFYAYRVSNPATIAASFTLTYTGGAGREVGHLLVLRNVDVTTPVDSFYDSYTGSNAAQATTVTVPAYTVPNDTGLTLAIIGAEFTSGQAHALSAAPSGYVQQAFTSTSTSTTVSRTASGVFSRDQDAGSTTPFSASWAAASGGAVQSVTFRGAENAVETPAGVDVQVWDGSTTGWVEATAYATDGTTQYSIDRLLSLRPDRITVDQWLAKAYGPSYMIHRGGSADWVEHTRQAYTNAVWLGATCLEASVWFSSDGVPFLCHDPDLSAMTNGADTRRIDSLTAAELDQVTITKPGVGSGEKLVRFSWLLGTYGLSHVLAVEDKSYNNMSPLLAIAESILGSLAIAIQHILIKANGGGGTGHMTLPNSKGYKSWGYFYTHNATPIPPESVPAKAALYTTIGIEWDSTQEAYTAALSLGIPLVVHIVPSAAAAITAKSRGGSDVGMQISSPLAVIPRLNEPLA